MGRCHATYRLSVSCANLDRVGGGEDDDPDPQTDYHITPTHHSTTKGKPVAYHSSNVQRWAYPFRFLFGGERTA